MSLQSLLILLLLFSYKINCITDKRETNLGFNICGNGIIEKGEECDCGNELECYHNNSNNCCIPLKCKLQNGAECAHGYCCNIPNCQFKSKYKICREKDINNDCDMSEYCTGYNNTCPEDGYKQNGMECKLNGDISYCYNGNCHTHSGQCKHYWGAESQTGSDLCYLGLNKLGNKYGSCGINTSSNSFIKCSNENTKCGKLFCNHNTNDPPRIGIAYEVYRFVYSSNDNTNSHTCISTDIRLDNNRYDNGFVYEGTVCGDNTICINHQCVSINNTTLAENRCHIGNGLICSGNGICSNLGVCYCNYRNYTNMEHCRNALSRSTLTVANINSIISIVIVIIIIVII